MQDNVIYSEVIFIRREEEQKRNQNAEVPAVDSVYNSEAKNPKAENSQREHQPDKAPSDNKACFHCAFLALAGLCGLLLGAVIALCLLYFTNDSKAEGPQLTMAIEDRAANLEIQQCPGNLSDDVGNNYKACPDDWMFYGRKCYFFSKDTLNWTQSRDNCISMGGHLTIINNKDEQEFLRKLLTSNKETTAFWIGLTDLQTENQWLWVDNSPLKDDIKFWAGKQPDNSNKESPTGEDCACIEHYHERNWFDNNCAKPHKRICETQSSNQA